MMILHKGSHNSRILHIFGSFLDDLADAVNSVVGSIFLIQASQIARVIHSVLLSLALNSGRSLAKGLYIFLL